MRAAADVVLTDEDGPLTRGARTVLMSIETEHDLAFLDALPPRPPHDAKAACGVIELASLLAHSVASLPAPKRARPAPSPTYAAMLARIVDDPWPVCVRTCATCETSRRRPEVVAVELLGEMTPSVDEPPPWDGREAETPEAGAADERAFRAWWSRRRDRLVVR